MKKKSIIGEDLFMNEAYGVNPRVSVLTSQRSTTMSPLVDVGLTCPLDLLPSLLNLVELPHPSLSSPLVFYILFTLSQDERGSPLNLVSSCVLILVCTLLSFPLTCSTFSFSCVMFFYLLYSTLTPNMSFLSHLQSIVQPFVQPNGNLLFWLNLVV